MASTSFKTKPGTRFEIGVKFFSQKSKSELPISMLLDTGASNIVLPGGLAKFLGVDLENGPSVRSVGQLGADNNNSSYNYKHRVTYQLGNLKPVTTDIFLSSLEVPLFGRIGGTANYELTITSTTATFTEIELIDKPTIKTLNNYVISV